MASESIPPKPSIHPQPGAPLSSEKFTALKELREYRDALGSAYRDTYDSIAKAGSADEIKRILSSSREYWEQWKLDNVVSPLGYLQSNPYLGSALLGAATGAATGKTPEERGKLALEYGLTFPLAWGLSQYGAGKLPGIVRAFTPKVMPKLEDWLQMPEMTPSAPLGPVAPFVDKMVNMIALAKPRWSVTKGLRTKELKRRVAVGAGRLERMEGEEAFRAAKGGLAGSMPTAEFTVPAEAQLTVEEGRALAEFIRTHPRLRFFDKLHAKDALEMLLTGNKIPRPHHLALLEGIFGSPLVRGVLEMRSTNQKAWQNLREAMNIPRAIMASFDVSAPFRQGLILTVTNPRRSIPAFWDMLRAFGKEEVAQSIDDSIRSGPFAALRDSVGLDLPRVSQEEPFMQSVIDRFARARLGGPGQVLKPLQLGARGVRASSRAYTTYLNKLRADTFDDLVREWQSRGVLPERLPTPDVHGKVSFGEEGAEQEKLLGDIAHWINIATGRGRIPAGQEELAAGLNTIFFSPRLLISRFQILDPRTYMAMHPEARRIAIKQLVSTVALGTGLLGIAKVAGADVEIDPRSSDFAKMRIGHTRIDPWGGFQQVVRIITQAGLSLARLPHYKSLRGEVKYPYSKPAGPSGLDTLVRFVQSKLTPPVGAVWERLAGETFEHEPATVQELLRERMMPMAARDIVEALTTEGLKGLAHAPLILSGMNVATYSAKEARAAPNIESMLFQLGYGVHGARPPEYVGDIWFHGLADEEVWDRQFARYRDHLLQRDVYPVFRELQQAGRPVTNEQREVLRKYIDGNWNTAAKAATADEIERVINELMRRGDREQAVRLFEQAKEKGNLTTAHAAQVAKRLRRATLRPGAQSAIMSGTAGGAM